MTGSTSLETAGTIIVLMILITGQYHTGAGVAFPGCLEASIWGIGLAGCWFLCAGKYIPLLISLLGMSGAAPAPGI